MLRHALALKIFLAFSSFPALAASAASVRALLAAAGAALLPFFPVPAVEAPAPMFNAVKDSAKDTTPVRK